MKKGKKIEKQLIDDVVKELALASHQIKSNHQFTTTMAQIVKSQIMMVEMMKTVLYSLEENDKE